MNQMIDLRERERAAFRTRFMDGLVDIQFGILLISVWFIMDLTHGRDFSTLVVLGGYVIWMIIVSLIPFLGRRYITAPRIGRMTPGPARRAKLWMAGAIMGVLIVVQAVQILLVRTGDWTFADQIQRLVPGIIFALPLVAMAYFNDFTRGYLYALFLDVGITWLLLGGGPVAFLVIGVLTLAIGIYVFLQFLHRYPRFEEAGN